MSQIIYIDYAGCVFDPPLEIDETHKTHFDEIKSMSVEELAEWVTTVGRTFGEEYEGYMSALDWLKQEAEKEGE